ncbi:MAG TPA: ABC transporter permease [Ktedonobacteraceae bacterium]|nr:ABC transporter permease [Ktedonobacteraceae bacterium]
MSEIRWSNQTFVFSSPTGRVYSPGLWRLMRNELFKMRRRPLVWGLFALDLLFVIAAWAVLVYYAMKSPDGFQTGHLLGGPDALSRAIGQPMTPGRRGGEFIALALGALTFGGEFSSGAIRLVFSRGVRRARYLLAKYLALAIVCFALVLFGFLLSCLLVNLLMLIHKPAPTLLNMNRQTIIYLLEMMVGTYENYLFCMLLGATISIIARSATFGIAAGFGYLIGEDIAAQILPVIGRSIHSQTGNQIVTFLFTPNLNAFYANFLPGFLSSTLNRLDGVIACTPAGAGCVPVTTLHALIVVLVWALILWTISTILFIRRDVLQ